MISREDTLGNNKLKGFNLNEAIFLDSNIFIDHGAGTLTYGKSCEEFLERVESKDLMAVTTTAVMEEVGYILCLLEGARILEIGKLGIVRKKLKEDTKLAALCYGSVHEYMNYLLFLSERGLNIHKVEVKDVVMATIVGGEYSLLFRDALHLSIMKRLKIRNIATRDSDFERVRDIKVWCP